MQRCDKKTSIFVAPLPFMRLKNRVPFVILSVKPRQVTDKVNIMRSLSVNTGVNTDKAFLRSYL